jgi:glycosyltransferase involved in cell wall biosynthesis
LNTEHISVCICTTKRPELLKRLLEALVKQHFDGSFTFSIVVVDNDESKSAAPVVAELEREARVPIRYHCEPRRNIARARNKAIASATGEFIAFLDDDEFPLPDWLSRLRDACHEFKAAGVLGPVRPHFDQPPPRWIVRGRFCERREHPTGKVMHWSECRTGNVLFRRDILPGDAPPFDEAFDTGGEDVDFFMRMSRRGCVFVWCNEAVAFETVPPSRWTRGYMLKRALLRGRNSLKLSRGRVVLVLKSVLAVPLYSVILPITLLFGQDRFMTYCIKLCDHVGRLLALVRLNPVKERQM